MTPSGQTICLCMIVKNEAPVIRRCLDSARPLIDRWIIVDTGSTDGTQALIRETLADVPGTLHERPWQDFAHNRSEALDLARSQGDYALIIDADDAFEIPADFRMPDLDADSYILDIVDTTIAYQRTQLVSQRLPWRYVGVLHEFLTCDGAKSSGHLPVMMRRNHDGARRRDPETYRRDAAILEGALKTETDPFLVSRYTFYLAQSYRDCGEGEKAVSAYLDRAALGYWDQEVFCSLLQAGRLMDGLGRDPEDVLAVYERATKACPSRAEAAHAASFLLRRIRQFERGYAVARPAIGLPAPNGGLFIETWIYGYGLLDEYAVNAYWAGHYRQSLDTCIDLLARAELPATHRERCAANARFALDKLATKSRRIVPPVEPESIGRKAPSGGVAAAQSAGPAWVPPRPQGGTEIMAEGLRRRLGPALDDINLCLNLYDDASLDHRPLVVWIHHNVDQAAVAWLGDAAKVCRVAWFVFVSDWQKARYVEQFGLRPEMCFVLRNATEVDRGNRRRVGGKPLKVAYTSVPYRGLSVLLDAWDRLQPEDAELHIWSSHKLYGANEDDTPYQKLYERAAAMRGVTYHGIAPNADLRVALRGIDILGYPSTFEETSCLSVIEAMAAGCRIVCPSLGALPETTGGFAHLYPFTPDASEHARRFAEALGAELTKPWGGRAVLAEEQQDASRRTYDWSVRVAEWQAFLDRVQAGRPVGRTSPTNGGPAVKSSNAMTRGLMRMRDRGFVPPGILDIGAHDGNFARMAREVFPEAHILMINALAEKEPVLAAVARDLGNASHLIALLGDRENDATPFFVVDTEIRPDLVKTGSSTFRENTEFPMNARSIPQHTLRKIIEGVGRPFPFIKLDVQGAELAVLRGLGEALSGVDAIMTEMSLVAYNDGAPLIDAVIGELAGTGFVLFDIVEEHRYRDGSLLQIDGIFVRSDAPLRPLPPFWT